MKLQSRSAKELSVVMPVHNALPHLDAAVQSILDQTFGDFELVVYDDASTDGSTERLRDWAQQDDRIRLFEGQRNLGPVGSSALVVKHSSAPLIARMDADDISHADRLNQQVKLLRGSPQAGLVGTLFDVIDDRGRRIRGPDYWRLTRKSPFVPFAAHGSIMFRRSVFDRVGGYREECEYWEDHDLVMRMGAMAEVLVIPAPLYRVRMWTKNTRASSDPERIENAVDLMYRSVDRLEQGRGYDDLLGDSPPPHRVDPRVFMAATSMRLWAGKRPQLFGRLVKRGRLRPDMRSLSALVLTGWAAVSPSTLRAFLRLFLKGKNLLARPVSSSSGPLKWSAPVIRDDAARAADCAAEANCYSSAAGEAEGLH
ncbi:MAG TPA: glycosyltransferase [Sphingomicrobium sp.]|nr:glycosyltransferase [Sphingomicrobium sp.]